MTRSTRSRLGTLGVALGVAALAAVYWEWKVVAPVRLPQLVSRWAHDSYVIVYPVFRFAYRSAFWLPAWNPHQLAGAPFLASYATGPLYLPNFLAAVLPVQRAMGIGCVLHLALAGAGALLCARALGLSLPAAAVAAVAFMLNSYLDVEHFRPFYLAGLAWFPLVALAAGWLVVRPAPRAGVALGAVLALQFLTGNAQSVCYGGYALVLVGAVLAAGRRDLGPGHWTRVALATGVAALVFVGLAAMQLAPTVELVAQAVRGFGGLRPDQTFVWTPSRERLGQALFSSGPAVLLAALALTLGGRRPLVACATVLVTFSLLVGLGTPVYAGFFHHLPGVNLFRNPHEMIVIGALGVSILAGLAVEELAAGAATWRRLLATVPLLAALAALRPPEVRLGYQLAVVGAAALLAATPWRATRGALAWVLLALLVAERLSQPGNSIMVPYHNDDRFFAPRHFVRFLRKRAAQDRILVIKDWNQRFIFMEKLGTLYGLNVVQDYEPLVPAAYHEFLRPLEQTNLDAPLFWGRFYPPPEHPGWRLLDMLAVRYVVVPRTVRWGAPGDRFTRIYADSRASIYENRASLPRAWLVREVRVVPDAASALAAVHAPAFDPRAVAVVDRPVEWAGPRAPAAADAVEIVTATPDRLVLRVAASDDSLLVLADLFWPGWVATVDGRRRDIVRADYLLRGVAVEGGTHTVEFRYESLALRLGVGTTGATVIVLLAALGRRRRGLPEA